MKNGNSSSCEKPDDFDSTTDTSAKSKTTWADFLSDSMIIDTLLNNSQDTIYFKDADSRFILNSRAHAVQFGVSDPNELVGKSDADFYPDIFASQSRQDELKIMKTGIPIINKLEQGMNAAGEVISFSTSKYPLYDAKGNVIGTWGTSRNVTKLVLAEEELAKANAKLRTLSLIDELTGLYNQRHFYDSMDTTIRLFTRRRSGGLSADFCLIFIDIDFFKHVNDTYGHVIGDAAIRFVAGLLLAHSRSSDLAFRYGGDEYALIVEDTDLPGGLDVAERLRKIVEHSPLVIEHRRIELTVSMGVVCFANETNAGDIVKKADEKLYQAKHDGKNRVCG